MEYIIGFVVSVIAQLTKKYIGDNDWLKMAFVFAVSLVAATIYYFVKDTTFWQTLLTIFTTAGATFAYLMRRLEK